MYLRKNDMPVIYEGYTDNGIGFQNSSSLLYMFILVIILIATCTIIYMNCKRNKQ